MAARKVYTLPAPAPGATSKQYKKALITKFRDENDKLAHVMSVLFVLNGKMAKVSAGPINITGELSQVLATKGGGSVKSFSVDKALVRGLFARSLALMKEHSKFVSASMSRKRPGAGGEAFNVPLIIKDDLYNFLKAASDANVFGGLPLPFLNSADPTYRITSRGILSTLMDIYRINANGGAGLAPASQGKSLLVGDQLMATHLSGIFTQIAADQQAKMQAAGGQLGQVKDAAKFASPKKDGKPRKVKETDVWRMDSLQNFHQNTPRSSVVAKGTYSTATMAQAAADPSDAVRGAYQRLSAIPKLEGDVRKEYARLFKVYAQAAVAQQTQTNSVTVRLPAQDTEPQLFGAAQADNSVGFRFARDILAVTVKNLYAQLKAARAPAAGAGVMSPGKFLEQRQ